MDTNNDPEENFLHAMARALSEACPDSGITELEMRYSLFLPGRDYGDVSTAIAYRLSGKMKKSPAEVAETLTKRIGTVVGISKVTHINGYINATFEEKGYTALILNKVLRSGNGFGSSRMGNGRKAIIESPSVNPNKPWHIGHLRSALLGDAVSNIFSFCGYNVEREDYIDDLGLQMAVVLWGSMNLAAKPTGKYDQFLGEQYVEINKLIESKKLEAEITLLLQKMENSASDEAKKARKMAEECVKAQYETAFAYGIYHDVMVWESDVVRERLLLSAIALLRENDLARMADDGEYKGCLVTDVGGGDKAKVLLRSNGVPTYLAKDIAFHMWKLGILHSNFRFAGFIAQPNGKEVYSTAENGREMEFGSAEIAINVIGSAQEHPQSILRSVLNGISGGRHGEVVHMSYGEIGVKGGSLSGREGGWLGQGRNYTADDLLREVKSKALEIVLKSEKITDKSSAEIIASKVAIAAIKFEFLRVDPSKKVTFEWERALNFDGNSGPYCMYTYARASSILTRAGTTDTALGEKDYAEITRGYDFEIVKMIGSAGRIIEKACRELRPNVIAEYVVELSILFSKFYENMPVLKGGDAMTLRLAIVHAVRQVIYNMIRLLGIEAVEKM